MARLYKAVFAEMVRKVHFHRPQSTRVTFSTVRFRTFCHATEDESKVRKALHFVTGGAPIEVSATKGHHGNRIAILESQLTKKKEMRLFWSSLAEAGLTAEILANLDGRIGDDLALGLRLDKQEAYADRLSFDRGGDVVHVRARVVAYPATRDGALLAARSYLSGLENR
ncbi:MAG: RNA-binding domain-containing protein [Methanobacteriota archaeon]